MFSMRPLHGVLRNGRRQRPQMFGLAAGRVPQRGEQLLRGGVSIAARMATTEKRASMDLTLLNLDEAAAKLRATQHFVRDLIGHGELRFVKIGKRYFVTGGDLDRWIESNRQLAGEDEEP
jgi:excisionase family DNA binding protein